MAVCLRLLTLAGVPVFSLFLSRLNAYVLVIFLLDLAICVGLSVLSGFFEYKYATHNHYLTVRERTTAHTHTHTRTAHAHTTHSKSTVIWPD